MYSRNGRRRWARGLLAFVAGVLALMAGGAVVRPGLAGTRFPVTDAGVRIGQAIPSRTRLACSAEDSVLVLAAPRQGKTLSVIIPWLYKWPGAAIVTSIRADVLMATAMLRLRRGPVAVMAPTGMIEWPHKLRWSPTSGCEDFNKAHARADVMVTVGKTREGSDSTDSGYFAMNATNLLAAWLHAAALSGGSARNMVSWAFNERLDAPIRILATHPGAADGTADMLDALYRLPPRPPGHRCGPPRKPPSPRCWPPPPGRPSCPAPARRLTWPSSSKRAAPATCSPMSGAQPPWPRS